jgi:hypothetical protein
MTGILTLDASVPQRRHQVICLSNALRMRQRSRLYQYCRNPVESVRKPCQVTTRVLPRVGLIYDLN